MTKTLRLAGTILFGFWTAVAQQQAPAPKKTASELRLELKLDKNEAVRGESILFELTLTNAGAEPADVDDSTPQNRAFAIRLNSSRGALTADTMSVALREGERAEAPAQPVKKTLEPNGTITVRGDLTAWFGMLEAGEYTATGGYGGSGKLITPSNKATLKVTQAAPVYSHTVQPDLLMPQQARETVWVNKTAIGADVFLIESSPKNPDVMYSNQRLASQASVEQTVASSYKTAPARVRHVVWATPEGDLQIIRLPRDGAPEGPTAIPLPERDLRPVETPFTGDDGTLHVVLATADGKSAGLLRTSPEAKTSYFPIDATTPLSSQRCLQWFKDGVFVLAWLSADGKEVFAASAELSDPPERITARKVLTTPFAVGTMAFTQRYNQTRLTYDRILIMIGADRGRETLLVRRADIRTGMVETDQRFPVAGLKGMTLFESALRDDLTPVCSFFDGEGGLWIAQPRVGRLTPVSDSTGAPVTRGCFPELVLPSRTSRLPGVYVRYIDQGKRLAVVKVGS